MDDETRPDPTNQPTQTLGGSLSQDFPDDIRNYRILRKLGEGGMGEVFEAEQLAPVRRRVALKLIKLGMDTKEVVARFESERQALALMNHVNIAQVFDAGATQKGRPYFAMEFVSGVPIVEYCDTQRMDIRHRLELFLQVLDGVQHAHQKGIIHRDLKPSNVLVKSEGDRPSPKIIDFGVAKATAHRLTDRTAFTEMGQLIGTPEYMSPEQAEMTGLDIDTRTDVYALGVLLYEMLIGAKPFDTQTLRSSGLDELRRKIREEDPPRPSTRLGKLSESGKAEAWNRHTERTALRRQVRGDLDCITLKAMEKDRTRRYGSVAEMALDIKRHLRNEPVLASPPSTLYRVRKFILRHRFGVATASVIVVALIVGIAGTTVSMLRALRAEQTARQEAETVRQIADFLVELFKVADPEEGRGATITAKEILDEGAADIQRKLSDRPQVQARLLATIGDVYESLGLYDKARPPLSRALEIQRELLGDDHVDLATSLNQMAVLLFQVGEHEKAIPMAERALEIRERELGPNDHEVAKTLGLLGNLYWVTGKRDEAKPLFERALQIIERAFGEDDAKVASPLTNLAAYYQGIGDNAAALPLFRRALKIRQTELGPNHPRLATTLTNLAGVLLAEGEYLEARPFYRRALAIQESSLGSMHPRVAQTLNNLAILSSRLGDDLEAKALYQRSLEINEAVHGPDHLSVARNLNNLGRLIVKLGEYAEARPLFERSVAVYERHLGTYDPAVATALNNLGDLLTHTGEYAAALDTLERALEIRRQSLPADHPHIAYNLNSLAELFASMGDSARAVQYYESALVAREAKLGADHPAVADTLAGLAAVLRSTGAADRASALEQRAVEIRARVDEPR